MILCPMVFLIGPSWIGWCLSKKIYNLFCSAFAMLPANLNISFCDIVACSPKNKETFEVNKE